MESKLMKDQWSQMFSKDFYNQRKLEQHQIKQTKQRVKAAALVITLGVIILWLI